MKLIYSLFGIIILAVLFSNMSSAKVTFQCYQETANVSTSCGGLNTGTYNKTSNYWYINYTVSSNAVNASWQVKYGVNISSGNPYFYNISIPNQCFNSSIMGLRFYSEIQVSTATSFGQCLNVTSSSWINITQLSNITW